MNIAKSPNLAPDLTLTLTPKHVIHHGFWPWSHWRIWSLRQRIWNRKIAKDFVLLPTRTSLISLWFLPLGCNSNLTEKIFTIYAFGICESRRRSLSQWSWWRCGPWISQQRRDLGSVEIKSGEEITISSCARNCRHLAEVPNVSFATFSDGDWHRQWWSLLGFWIFGWVVWVFLRIVRF